MEIISFEVFLYHERESAHESQARSSVNIGRKNWSERCLQFMTAIVILKISAPKTRKCL